MATRKKIGLVFTYDDEWIAGSYYILNIIKALREVDDKDKPFITVFYWNEAELSHVKSIEYPYIQYLNMYIQLGIADRIINKLSRMIIGRDIIQRSYSEEEAEVVYGFQVTSDIASLKNIPKHAIWLPDFQERHYPEFFPEKELIVRKEIHQKVINASQILVFSSQNVVDDFNKYYPDNEKLTNVLNFVSILPEFPANNKEALLEKYQLSEPYFFAPNQFWQHKNHIVILKAIAILKSKNLDYKVVFTGKQSDYRNQNYFSELEKYITENELQSNVSFLGFIDRKDQLQLLDFALCVIQPSLFEGWSTVVEDSKALSQYMLLSDIGVHKEQLKSNCTFFDPANSEQLAGLMEKSINEGVERENKDYRNNIATFNEQFKQIFFS